MTDSYDRIHEHLGIALQRLSLFEKRGVEGYETRRDTARCVAELQRVAEELAYALDSLKTERRRLTAVAEEAEAAMRRARKLFVESPDPCLVLRREGGAIAEANAAASRLLNVSQRHLVGKAFTNFLQKDRDAFLQNLKNGSGRTEDAWEVSLRPRERAVLRVLVKGVPDADGEDTAAIVLSPAANGAAADD